MVLASLAISFNVGTTLVLSRTCVNFAGEVLLGISADFETVSIVAGCFTPFDAFWLSDASVAAPPGSGRWIDRQQQPQKQRRTKDESHSHSRWFELSNASGSARVSTDSQKKPVDRVISRNFTVYMCEELEWSSPSSRSRKKCLTEPSPFQTTSPRGPARISARFLRHRTLPSVVSRFKILPCSSASFPPTILLVSFLQIISYTSMILNDSFQSFKMP